MFVCAPVEHAGNSLSLADPRVFQSLEEEEEEREEEEEEGVGLKEEL